MQTAKRVALVIGAGAVKCAAALGVWRVLAREGVPIDLLVGCSGGSLFASVMALGHAVDECVTLTQRLWNRGVTEKRNWRALLGAALPGVFGFDERFGMVHDGPMLAALRSVYGDATFADARTPLRVVATDFRTGEQVVLSSGKLVDALRASVAIPFIWAPWPVEGRLLTDGSAANPLPIDVAIQDGYPLIIAVGFESPAPRKIKSVSRFAFHVNSLMTNNLYRANFAFQNLAQAGEIVTLSPEFERPIGLFDTHEFPYVIAQGERAAEAQLAYIQEVLAGQSQN